MSWYQYERQMVMVSYTRTHDNAARHAYFQIILAGRLEHGEHLPQKFGQFRYAEMISVILYM